MAGGDLYVDATPVLTQDHSLHSPRILGVHLKNAPRPVLSVRWMDLRVMKRAKLFHGPAAETLGSRTGIDDHSRLDVSKNHGIAHGIEDKIGRASCRERV